MNSHFNIAVDNNIGSLRRAKGITQRELAWACYQNEGEIRKYEKATRFPGYPVLRRMALFLEADIEEIYPRVVELDKHVEVVRESLRWKDRSNDNREQ